MSDREELQEVIQITQERMKTTTDPSKLQKLQEALTGMRRDLDSLMQPSPNLQSDRKSIADTVVKVPESTLGQGEDLAVANRKGQTFRQEDYRQFNEAPGYGTQLLAAGSDLVDNVTGFFGGEEDPKPNKWQQEVDENEAHVKEVYKQNKRTYDHLGTEERHNLVDWYAGKGNTPPETMLDGSALKDGVYYRNVSDGKHYVYKGGDWVQEDVNPKMPYSLDWLSFGPGSSATPFGIGIDQPTGRKIQTVWEPNPNYDPNDPASPKNIQRTYTVPEPLEDNSAWTEFWADSAKVGDDALYRTATGLTDLVTGGHILGTGPEEQARVKTEMTGGERLAADIATFALAGLSGKALVDATIKSVGAGVAWGAKNTESVNKIANATKSAYDKVFKATKNPAKAQAAAKKAATVVAQGTGIIAAELGVTPEGSEGLVLEGGDIKQVFKSMDDNTADATAIAIESALIGTTLRSLGIAFSKAKEAVVGKVNPLALIIPSIRKKTAYREQGMAVLNYLDPSMAAEKDPQLIAHRMRLFAQTLENNGEVTLNLLKGSVDIDVSSLNAFAKGAREYVSAAYGAKKDILGDAKFEEFVQTKSAEILNNFVTLHQRKGAHLSEMAMKEATANTKIQQLLDNSAEGLVNDVDGLVPTRTVSDAADQTAEILGTKAMDTVGTAKQAQDAAQKSLDNIADQTDEAFRVSASDAGILSPDAANAANPKAMLDNIAGIPGEQTAGAIKASRQAVNAAFSDLPDDIPVDWSGFFAGMAQIAPNARNPLEALKTLGMESEGYNAIKAVLQPRVVRTSVDVKGVTKDILETPSEIIERLNNDNSYHFKQLYNDLRPVLEDDITRLLKEGSATMAKTPISIKGLIDSLAEDTGVVDLQNAMSMHQDYVKVFGTNSQVKRVAGAAQVVNPNLVQASGLPKGSSEFRKVAREALQQSDDEILDEVLIMLSSATGKNAQQGFSDYQMAQISKKIYEGMMQGTVDNNAIKVIQQSITPSLEKLRRVNPEQAKRLEQLSTHLQSRLSKLGDDKVNFTSEIAAQAKIIDDTHKSVLNNFVDGLKGEFPELIGNPELALSAIFTSKKANAPNVVGRLVQEAKALPPQQSKMVLASIRGSFLQDLEDRIFTNSKTALSGVTESGMDAASTTAKSTLYQMDKGYRDSTLRMASRIFGKNSDEYLSIQNFIHIQTTNDLPALLRGSATPGSNTMDKSAQAGQIKEATDTINIMLFGILNRTATIVRRLTGGPVEAAEKELKALTDEAMKIMLVEPREFGKIIRMNADRTSKGVGINNLTEKATQGDILKELTILVVRNSVAPERQRAVYQAITKPSDTTIYREDQTEKAFAQ